MSPCGNDFLLQLPVSVGMISKNMFWVGKDLHCLMSLSFIMVLTIRFQIFALGEKKLCGALQVSVEVSCWWSGVGTARWSAVGTGAAPASRCQRLSGHCAHDTTLMVTFAQCFEQALNILKKDTLANKMLSFDPNLRICLYFLPRELAELSGIAYHHRPPREPQASSLALSSERVLAQQN